MTKENKGKGKAGAIFTAVMVLCCIGLYLLGSRGEEEIVATSDSSATPVPVQEKQRAYPSAEVFFDRAKEYGLEGQALHAARLELTQPATGERMTFKAKVPEYFASALKKAGRNEPKDIENALKDAFGEQ